MYVARLNQEEGNRLSVPLFAGGLARFYTCIMKLYDL